MSDTIKTLLIAVVICLFTNSYLLASSQSGQQSVKERIDWDNSLELPSLNGKKHPGVGGVFSGFIGSNLIIAGGANFPDRMPWQGGKKVWWNTLYFADLSANIPAWHQIDNILPGALAYGVSIDLPDGILCIGGNDGEKCYKEVFQIKLKNNKVTIDTDWPSLPVPLTNATGVFSGNKIYILGGEESLHPEISSNHFFMLDLSQVKKGWVSLPSWPGKSRGYAVSVAQSDGFDNCIYLFSGRYYDEQTVEPLTDGYVYNPRLNSWDKLENEFPLMAATAVPVAANHILMLGGVKKMIPGSDNHPGFDNTVRIYHTITGTLIEKEVAPYPITVTTNARIKDGTVYLTSGETHPGIRTPHILRGKIIPFEKGLGMTNILVIILYFACLAGIGFYFSKKQKNTDDYFKGGGRLPWWAVGLSIFGTSLSAITFMSIPAKSYATDWSYMMVNAGILMVVPIILYLFIPFYRKLNVTTAYEYLEQRFNYTIRVLCSLAFILFQIGRMGIVMFLPAIALNVVTGFDIFWCIGLMGVLSLLYTMMGGIEAVVWTDALQVVVLLGGAILVVVIALVDIPGGLSTVIQQGGLEGKFSLGSLGFDLKQSTLWTVLIATFFTNLTTYGTDQTMVQRYMTTETEKQAKKSVLTNAILTVPATVLFFFVGTVLYIYYKSNPMDLSLTLTDGDAILPWYIFSKLPPGIVGLLISGIFAAAMSTLSSSMNSAATAYVTDIHNRFFPASANSLTVAKIATFVLGFAGIAFAFMMATWEIKSLWDEFNKILGLILGSMGGLFLLGMITRKANSIGAVCGIVGSIIVQLMMIRFQTVHLLLYTTTGFLSCFIIGYLVSLMTPGNKKNITSLTIYGLFTKSIQRDK